MKLSLNPPTTFKHKVDIPVAGGKAVPIEFEFKYRNRDELRAYMESEQTNEDAVLDAVVGWALDDEFNEANVRRLCVGYPGAAYAIVTTYLAAYAGR